MPSLISIRYDPFPNCRNDPSPALGTPAGQAFATAERTTLVKDVAA
jgi:hypothetical protein